MATEVIIAPGDLALPIEFTRSNRATSSTSPAVASGFSTKRAMSSTRPGRLPAGMSGAQARSPNTLR